MRCYSCGADVVILKVEPRPLSAHQIFYLHSLVCGNCGLSESRLTPQREEPSPAGHANGAPAVQHDRHTRVSSNSEPVAFGAKVKELLKKRQNAPSKAPDIAPPVAESVVQIPASSAAIPERAAAAPTV